MLKQYTDLLFDINRMQQDSEDSDTKIKPTFSGV